jgi:hypothetical protein
VTLAARCFPSGGDSVRFFLLGLEHEPRFPWSRDSVRFFRLGFSRLWAHSFSSLALVTVATVQNPLLG